VIAISSPREALELAATSEKFQILLTDLQLGDRMSGLDLAHELCIQRPGLVVAITTGYLAPEDAKRITPGWVILEKPVTSDKLVSAISALARQNRAAQASA
ncbi:MAG: response regulator, partial [Rhodospirillaceae bacterium]|nr:response regulator [Rhodospirillaceae bacterium]